MKTALGLTLAFILLVCVLVAVRLRSLRRHTRSGLERPPDEPGASSGALIFDQPHGHHSHHSHRQPHSNIWRNFRSGSHEHWSLDAARGVRRFGKTLR